LFKILKKAEFTGFFSVKNIIFNPNNFMSSFYKICSNCILDTIDDADLRFDSRGVCNYCNDFYSAHSHNTQENKFESGKELLKIISEIKEAGKNKPYDCILGVSGGVDSTYLAYQAKKLGLRPLIIHYDNGWNSELAVMNIENLIRKLDFNLYTYVNDWDEFKDLQLSFMKASVVDIELLTDHAIGALQFMLAKKYNVKYILSGANNATEAVLPPHWYHWKTDALNITSIHSQFGTKKLKTYPLLGYFKRLYYTRVLKIQTIPLLDYLPFNKEDAKRTIIKELDWKDYGGKHYESIFTRFYQSYILPRKFKIDKRKAHLSTLICSGQITREEALLEMKKEIFPADKLREDKAYVIKKLGLSEEEFENIMRLPIKRHTDYPSYLTRHYKYEALIAKKIKPLKKLFKKSG